MPGIFTEPATLNQGKWLMGETVLQWMAAPRGPSLLHRSPSSDGSGPVHPAPSPTFPGLDPNGPTLSHDPIFGRLALNLLWVAASETVQNKRSKAGAVFSRGGDGSPQWEAYAGKVQRALTAGSLPIEEVRALMAQAPSQDRGSIKSLSYLFQESDPQLFAESLLHLAQRNLSRGRHPALTQALLMAAREHPATRARAGKLLKVLAGEGGFLGQLEYQTPHFVSELTSPLFLVPFGLAIGSARWASLSVLAKAPRFTVGTWLRSELAALSVEVPTLVVSRRVGLKLFVGGEHLLSPQSIGKELLATYGPFAFLRLGSNVIRFASPMFGRVPVLQNAEGQLNPLGRFTLGTTQVGTEVSALMAGHSLNHLVGIAPDSTSTEALFYSSLMTVAHMRLAGGILQKFWPQGLGHRLEQEQGRILASKASGLFGSRSSGVEGEFLTQGQFGSRHPLALAGAMSKAKGPSGGREGFGFEPSRRPEPLLSEGNGDGKGKGRPPGSEGAPPSSEGNSPMSPTRLELLRRRLTEYFQESEGSKEPGGVVKVIQNLIDRFNRNPEEAKQESFKKEVREVGKALKEVQENETRKLGVIRRIKDILDRNTPPGGQTFEELVESQAPEPAPTPEEPTGFFGRTARWLITRKDAWFNRPSEQDAPQKEITSKQVTSEETPVPEGSDEINVDALRQKFEMQEEEGEETIELIKKLRKVPGLLLAAASKGEFSQNAQERVSALFQSLKSRVAGVESGPPKITGESEEALRRQGALLGLGVKSSLVLTDSPLSSSLRQELDSNIPPQDMELELLHYTLMDTVFYNASPKQIGKLGGDYGASPESIAAMQLYGKVLKKLFQGRLTPDSMMKFLEKQAVRTPMAHMIGSLESALHPGRGMLTALMRLGGTPEAFQYLNTGLYLFFKAEAQARDLEAQGKAEEIPKRFLGLIEEAGSKEVEGFHPSIAISLFGALRGRNSLSDGLFPKGFLEEDFVGRALADYQEGE